MLRLRVGEEVRVVVDAVGVAAVLLKMAGSSSTVKLTQAALPQRLGEVRHARVDAALGAHQVLLFRRQERVEAEVVHQGRPLLVREAPDDQHRSCRPSPGSRGPAGFT